MSEKPASMLDRPLPGARSALTLLLLINLFNYIDRQVLAAVVTPIRETFFQNPDQPPDGFAIVVVTWLQEVFGFKPENALIGSLALAFMGAYMLLAPVFGWLAERSRRWLLVGIGVIAWSLATGGSGLAATFTMLFLTRCCVGVGEAVYGPVAPAMISDLYPVKIRGSVLAWFYAAIPVGSALGYVLGGAVAKITGDWRWAFYLVVPPGILLGLLCFMMKEPPRGQADLGAGQPVRRAGLSAYLILLKTPSYVLCTLGMTAMAFAVGGIAFWMPDYVHDFRGEGELWFVNLLFGMIVVVTGLIATLAGGIAGDRLRPRYPGSYFLVSSVGMFIAFPFFLLVLYLPFPWAWIFVAVAVFFLFFNTGPTNTILANVSHPSVRASAFALNILIIHGLGDAISPLIIGAIADATAVDNQPNLQAGFLFVSGMILLSGALWGWGSRYLQRDTEMAPRRLD